MPMQQKWEIGVAHQAENKYYFPYHQVMEFLLRKKELSVGLVKKAKSIAADITFGWLLRFAASRNIASTRRLRIRKSIPRQQAIEEVQVLQNW